MTKTPSGIEKKLADELAKMEVVDCHEHLPPEKERVAQKADVFTLFSHYTADDLFRSGMKSEDYQSLFNRDIPLEKRWQTFAPFWEKIRWTSYSKAALLAAEKFYGATDINGNTFRMISERIAQANRPGLYEKVLRKACLIRTCLTQCGRTDLGTDLLTPVMPMPNDFSANTREEIFHPKFDPKAEIRSLEDYIESVARYIKRVRAEGAVGLKMVVQPYEEPDRKKAAALFDKLKRGRIKKIEDPPAVFPDFPKPNPLSDYLKDESIKLADKENLVVAVHTGYWGDFRTLSPLHMIPILKRHPTVRFDIYHLGYPWPREALMLGKGFSNVWLNFCWTHIISQRFAFDALDEAIDLIPSNKILAFGGDYRTPVEKVYGHLVMAKENVVGVLGKRVRAGRMRKEQAIDLARKWFWDNPNELYNLKLGKKTRR